VVKKPKDNVTAFPGQRIATGDEGQAHDPYNPRQPGEAVGAKSPPTPPPPPAEEQTPPAKPVAAKKPGSNELTAAERRTLLLTYVREFNANEEKLKPFMEARKAIKSRAKLDGIKSKDLDVAIYVSNLDDGSLFIESLQVMHDIAVAFSLLPEGEQGSLFPDRRPLDDRAYDEGKTAGLLGKDPKPPYSEASPAGQRWLAGWHEGQKDAAANMQSAMEKRNDANAAKAAGVKAATDAPLPVDADPKAKPAGKGGSDGKLH
jgi:ribosome modulation factor